MIALTERPTKNDAPARAGTARETAFAANALRITEKPATCRFV